MGGEGALSEQKLVISPQNEPPEGLHTALSWAIGQILSRNCWNYHLVFLEKFKKNLKKSEIQPVFQTSPNGIYFFFYSIGMKRLFLFYFTGVISAHHFVRVCLYKITLQY